MVQTITYPQFPGSKIVTNAQVKATRESEWDTNISINGTYDGPTDVASVQDYQLTWTTDGKNVLESGSATLVLKSGGSVRQTWESTITPARGGVSMNNTAPYDPSINSSLPVGHAKDGSYFGTNYNYALANPMLFGAGSIVTTGDDMMKWLQLHMGQGSDSWRKMLKQQQAKTWQRNPCPPPPNQSALDAQQGPVVSLGWFHQTVPLDAGGNATILFKDGGHSGFTSWLGFEDWFDGKDDSSSTGCFVLTNSSGARPLGLTIMNLLLGNSNPSVSTSGEEQVELDAV